jgi:glycosyltransferase involved in cell wall biosynthesis
MDRMRVCFALPGLHCINRGAETTFESVGEQLAADPAFEVTLIGAGPEIPSRNYRYLQALTRMRNHFESWPRLPLVRNPYRWEELSFIAGLQSVYSAADYDCTITCSYPFVNWRLRANRRNGAPAHIFVTQNGDWPARGTGREYLFFGCDGLICTNPEFFERHRNKWNATLIPNGVAVDKFSSAKPDRGALGLPADATVVLMAGALVPQKRIIDGITLLRGMRDLFLLIVGDGPMRAEVIRAAELAIPGRWRLLALPFQNMPTVYASSDLLLHMATEESFGNIYVEALAAALPVVAQDSMLTRWIFGAENGERLWGPNAWLVETNRHSHVVSALQSVLLRRRAHKPAAAILAGKYSWETIARKYADFIREVVRRG